MKTNTSAIAVYAGTFDPITHGHCDIVDRAASIFGKIVVAVAQADGEGALFGLEDRVSMVREAVKDIPGNIEVHPFNNLLVDFVREVGSRVIIRGLRAVSDYEYEAQMAIINRQVAKDIETVFLMTSKRASFISSSSVREIAKFGGDVSTLVPESVAKKLKEVYSSKYSK
jgi:pantetheine-phosphate adenylyltransferase